MRRLRVTNVGFLNSAPFRELAKLGWVDYSEAEPAECARNLLEEATDLACIPLAEFVASGELQALPFGIAAKGQVKSVVLLSQQPLDKLSVIYIDQATQSAFTLLRVLIGTLHPKRLSTLKFYRVPRSEAIMRADGECGALVIGDLNLTALDTFSFRLDLGQCWHELTGLPFVFGIWAGHLEKLTDSQRNDLQSAFLHGIAQREAYAVEWAGLHGAEPTVAVDYVENSIHYAINSTCLSGMLEFYRRGVTAGVLPASTLENHNCTKLATLTSDDQSGTTAAAERASAVGPQHLPRVDPVQLPLDRRRLSIRDGIVLVEETSRQPIGASCTTANRPVASVKEHMRLLLSVDSLSYLLQQGRSVSSVLRELITSDSIAANLHRSRLLLVDCLNPQLSLEHLANMVREIATVIDVAAVPLPIELPNADELTELSSRFQVKLTQLLQELFEAGARRIGPVCGPTHSSLPVRQGTFCSLPETLNFHRTAHRLGYTSSCCMALVNGHSWRRRIFLLHQMRQLQDETGGLDSAVVIPQAVSDQEVLCGTLLTRQYLDNVPIVGLDARAAGEEITHAALDQGADVVFRTLDILTRPEQGRSAPGIRAAN